MLPPAVTQKLKQIQLFENIGGAGYKSRKLELLEQRQNISHLHLFISRQETKVLQYHCCIRTQTHTASLSSSLPCDHAAEETQCEWLGAGGMIALARRIAFTWLSEGWNANCTWPIQFFFRSDHPCVMLAGRIKAVLGWRSRKPNRSGGATLFLTLWRPVCTIQCSSLTSAGEKDLENLGGVVSIKLQQ